MIVEVGDWLIKNEFGDISVNSTPLSDLLDDMVDGKIVVKKLVPFSFTYKDALEVLQSLGYEKVGEANNGVQKYVKEGVRRLNIPTTNSPDDMELLAASLSLALEASKDRDENYLKNLPVKFRKKFLEDWLSGNF